ncbi:hypothetical protein [Limnobacter sp.]|uniref:hypothetical protein n=1 Tax=Limnobacter sp. TaxID=2003368 RepID=UPI003519D5E2
MNKRIFGVLSFAAALGLGMLTTPAKALNISVGVGGEVAPGVYGNVNITNSRYPVLVYNEPLIVTRPSRILEPIYLHVPPGHLKKWGKYCGRYGACSRPVYFVKSRDYYDFSPAYIEQRYIYRDRVTYVRDGEYRDGYYDGRRDERKWQKHHDRHDWDDDHRKGKHWKHDDHHRGGKHGKRERDDD